jgi:primosomal protein N' (replication factor Y)
VFDYTLPAGLAVVPGCRVRVPLARRRYIGVVLENDVTPACGVEQLRPVVEVLDEHPLVDAETLALAQWAARYYHHPVGEVVVATLPARLRRADRPLAADDRVWRLTPEGLAQLDAAGLSRAPRQAEVLRWLAQRPAHAALRADLRQAVPGGSAVIKALQHKGWVETAPLAAVAGSQAGTPPVLNRQQEAALAQMAGRLQGFSVTVLEGVTGSGKTEVYLRLADQVLRSNRSVLVLVPEIALTPQLLARFRTRLDCPVDVLHSGLSDGERERTWHRARQGIARVLLGTRSAVFTPLPALGLVVVDEEHDPSFKQIEGLRYSARDLAIVRAQRAACPVVLGSATPSLETLQHAQAGDYALVRLDQRAGRARAPRIDLIDLRTQPLQRGLSALLLDRLAATLADGEQAMLFLNRRGYAPVMSCFTCGWVSACAHCDAHQTLHRQHGRLICHHCGAQRPVPSTCPDCGADNLQPIGQGTEQLEDFLASRFPDIPLMRVDRDATARKGSLEGLLGRLAEPGPALLVGTQMLAKGHDFPNVTLVGVVDADSGLYSADFRASERLAQLLVQVAGRAGRGERPGRVLIQTRHPDHPLLQTLVRDGYRGFASAALRERAEARLPPFSHQVLLRASARRMADAQGFLERAAGVVAALPQASQLSAWGPVAAPMARRAGRERAQLLLQASGREALHRALSALTAALAELPAAHRVRWSLDVDPVDLY